MKISLRARTWLYALALVGVAEPIVAFDVYALFFNDTAHTSLPTRWLAWGLLAVASVAAAAYLAERRGPSRTCRAFAVAILLVGLTGAANVWAFEHLNVMMDYEIWVHDKRMPAKYAPPGMGFQLPRPQDPTPSQPPE
jgi:4-amino-4-deoxy-L-arabinose transferase-like glycosyltransferase